ncbi:MAG: transglycosylase SLT domain-containing protein, partial [Pseudomonas fluorescens]
TNSAAPGTPGTAPADESITTAPTPGTAPDPEMRDGVYPNDPEPADERQAEPSPGTRSVKGNTAEIHKRAAESDRKAGLPPRTTEALMAVESSFDSGAVSNKGARGLFQIMPENVAKYSKDAKRKLDPHNTDDAFYMYDELMAERRRTYGKDTNKMLRSYHGGYDEDRWGPANRDYLPAIDKKKRELAASESQRQQQQTYQMPQTMQHAVMVDVTMRDPTGNRMNNVSIDTSVGRPVVNGSGAKVL